MKYLNGSKNWKWNAVDFDYDTRTNCEEYGCDQYCRCGKIINEKVTFVNTWSIAKYLVGTKDKVLTYCVERILIANNIYDNDKWYIGVCGGYYGEEIDKITLSDTSVNQQLKFLYSLGSDTERIKFVLTEEYGYLLESLKDLKFSIKKIKKGEIKIPNADYDKKIAKSSLECYLDSSYNPEYTYQGPLCLVRKDDDGNYILVDGYHRFAAHDKGKNSKVDVVVGS